MALFAVYLSIIKILPDIAESDAQLVPILAYVLEARVFASLLDYFDRK